MFRGTEDDLKQTRVTQPAVFLHSIIAYRSIENAKPDMVAGHSLGEFSALVVNGTLSFEDALSLVSVRAQAMQKACELNPSTMAAVLGTT
jgi:[acyl-carrier-protein] S-malonyltransferase